MRSPPTSGRSAPTSGRASGLVAVVKANAYGHGAVPVATTALEAGADGLAVGRLDEAVELRNAGIIRTDLGHGAGAAFRRAALRCAAAHANRP